jgi:hypothetical protein
VTDFRTIIAEHLYRASELAAVGPVGIYTDTAAYLLDAIAEPANRRALATWLVEAGVFVHAESVTDDGGEGFVWIDDLVETSPTVDVGPRDWDQHLPHMVPVYRIGGGRG